MSFKLIYSVQVAWVPDGQGAYGFPQNGAVLTLNGTQVVPGFNQAAPTTTPTGANFTTATTSMGTDISNQINVAATLARIQGFSTAITQ